MPKRINSDERLADNICLRITTKQRSFLEKRSEQMNINVCEAARSVLDEAMARAGANGV